MLALFSGPSGVSLRMGIRRKWRLRGTNEKGELQMAGTGRVPHFRVSFLIILEPYGIRSTFVS